MGNTLANRVYAVDAKAMKATVVISTSRPDHQGDVLEPDGMDTSVHETNPVVFYDHRRSHPLPIGKSKDPSGNYTVRRDGDVWVADTYFSQSDRFAGDVFKLVDEGILLGASVGFAPGDAQPIRKSRGDQDRPPYRFNRWTLHEYSHTPAPVNPEALTVALQKGSWHPLITKSLAPYMLRSGSAVRGGFSPEAKAMEDESLGMPQAADPGEPAVPPDEPMLEPDGDDGVTPTAKAAYDGAQAMLDAAMLIEESLKASEHLKGKQKLMKCLDNIRAEAEELKAIGDMVADSLSDGDADDAGGDVEPDVDGEEPEEIETDDDGAVVVKGYKPRRLAVVAKSATNAVTLRMIAKSVQPPRTFVLAGTEVRPVQQAKSKDADDRKAQRFAREVERLARKVNLNIPTR